MKESFGDMHNVPSGERFTKVWTMRNDGKHEWPVDTTLINTNGDDLKATPVLIGSVRAGAEIEVKVDLTAPKESGKYTTYFRMRTGDNYRFGHKVWADILVKDIPEPVVVPIIEAPKPVQQVVVEEYPDIDLYEDVDKSNGEPIVQIVTDKGQDKTSSFEDAPTVDIKQVHVTPKEAYYQKVAQVVEPARRDALRDLFSMGFINFEVNNVLLLKHNNDTQNVLNILCDESLSESTVIALTAATK